MNTNEPQGVSRRTVVKGAAWAAPVVAAATALPLAAATGCDPVTTNFGSSAHTTRTNIETFQGGAAAVPNIHDDRWYELSVDAGADHPGITELSANVSIPADAIPGTISMWFQFNGRNQSDGNKDTPDEPGHNSDVIVTIEGTGFPGPVVLNQGYTRPNESTLVGQSNAVMLLNGSSGWFPYTYTDGTLPQLIPGGSYTLKTRFVMYARPALDVPNDDLFAEGPVFTWDAPCP